MPDLAADAALAADLVREAALLAARLRVEGLDVSRKTSWSDIVTQADTAAERLIVQQLAAERPDDAIVGEEGTSRLGTSGRTWVIDPVDGTYNFSRGSDWWCSAIALHDEDDVLLGAVHHAAGLVKAARCGQAGGESRGDRPRGAAWTRAAAGTAGGRAEGG